MLMGKRDWASLYSQIIGQFIQFLTKRKRGIRPGKKEVCFFCRCVSANALSKPEKSRVISKASLLIS